MTVALTIKQASEALSRLDPVRRAMLDLSLRRGMREEEIAAVLNITTPEVEGRLEEVLDALARELSLDSREQRDELRATLPDLPPDAWQ
jgi:DNA-directed RNA polymerase specialized sigma24 family protein